MYVHNQATAYPSGLHISKATDVKIVVDKVCPHLPIWDTSKNKGFKLHSYDEMPTRQMKVNVVNYSKNWSSFFSGKKLVQAPNIYNAKTFWNQIVWADTLKASSSNYDGSDNVDHHDFIQVLRLSRCIILMRLFHRFIKEPSHHIS